MIEQSFLKKHFVGRDGFIWWIGQIASEESWIANFEETAVATTTQMSGFGERYKVRIMGYHTANPNDLPDDDLPWATVMYPVTAGSGGRGYYETSQLAQGNFVFGFFLDGDDAQQPVIMGVIGNNDYHAVMKNVPNTSFVPFSGFSAKDASKISPSQVNVVPENPAIPQINANLGSTHNSRVTESVLQSKNGKITRGAVAQAEATKDKTVIPVPETDEAVPVNRIQKQIRKGIQEIEKLRKTIYDIQSSLSKDINKLNDKIQKRLDRLAKLISGALKNLYNDVMNNIMNAFNWGIGKILDLIPADYKPIGEEASAIATSELKCAIRSLIDALVGTVAAFVRDAASKIINVPLCFAEKFVGGFIGAAKGAASAATQGALNTVMAASNLALDAVSIASDVMSAIDAVFNFSFCNTENNQSIVEEWSVLLGAGGGQLFGGRGNIIDRIGQIPDKVEGVVDSATNTFDNVLSNVDFATMFDTAGCDTGPITCGPPIVQFFGKNGAEAAGNLVIGVTGEVLGVDMYSFGSGYDNDTKANVVDNCGRGVGAQIQAVMGTVGEAFQGGGTIVATGAGISEETPGNYVYYPNGSGPDVSETPTIEDSKPDVSSIDKFTKLTQGTANVTIRLSWDDNPNTAGVAVKSIRVGDKIWKQSGEKGEVTRTLQLFGSNGSYEYKISFDGLNVSNSTIEVSGNNATNQNDTLKLRDSSGIDANAKFTIISTTPGVSAKFSDDGRKLLVTGIPTNLLSKPTQTTTSQNVNFTARFVTRDNQNFLRVEGNGSGEIHFRLRVDDNQLISGPFATRIQIGTGLETKVQLIRSQKDGLVQEVETIEGSGYFDAGKDYLVQTYNSNKDTGFQIKNSGQTIEYDDNISNGFDENADLTITKITNVSSRTTLASTSLGVVDVIVLKSGRGYLPAEDGSLGGDGRTWATRNDTTIQHIDNTYEVPIPPGFIVNVRNGDTVRTPIGSRVVIEPTGEELLGGKDTFIKGGAGSFTAPAADTDSLSLRGDYPSSSAGTYPVILYLCDIPILDSGVGYQEDDQIIIEPSLGAKAIPQFDGFGRLVSIQVTEGGEGFTSRPDIYIKSETGINAKLIPKFCIDRVSEERVREVGLDKVIQVVDCVGKV